MAQQVEHVLGKDEVTGSNPVSSSILPLLQKLQKGLLITANRLTKYGRDLPQAVAIAI